MDYIGPHPGGAHTTKHGRTRYRYYVCLTAQKRGWDACPSKSLPAKIIEGYVLDHPQAPICSR